MSSQMPSWDFEVVLYNYSMKTEVARVREQLYNSTDQAWLMVLALRQEHEYIIRQLHKSANSILY